VINKDPITFYYLTSSTTSDTGGSSMISLPPEMRAPSNGAGVTTFGFSNVLCAVISPAVSMRPATPDALNPLIAVSTVRPAVASRLLIVMLITSESAEGRDAVAVSGRTSKRTTHHVSFAADAEIPNAILR
jgi:hypothetical protein